MLRIRKKFHTLHSFLTLIFKNPHFLHKLWEKKLLPYLVSIIHCFPVKSIHVFLCCCRNEILHVTLSLGQCQLASNTTLQKFHQLVTFFFSYWAFDNVYNAINICVCVYTYTCKVGSYVSAVIIVGSLCL